MNFQPPDLPDHGNCVKCGTFIEASELSGDGCVNCTPAVDFKTHNPNGARRPVGVKPDQKVHVKGGGQELIATADRVDWRNVSAWKETDAEATLIVNYANCDGECD